MWRGFVGSCWLGPGCPVLRANTRENPVGKNGVMTVTVDLFFTINLLKSLLFIQKNQSNFI